MNTLDEYTIDELLEEIELRKKRKPNPQKVKNFGLLIDLCIKYIETIARGEYMKDDAEHYIFEAAMEGAYGKDIWKWINERLK